MDRLSEWKEKSKNSLVKPILMTGTRGVGKTYLSYEFGKSFYQDIIYINFERNTKLKRLFWEDELDQIIINISQYFQKTLDKDIILILDEIGDCQEGIQFILQEKVHKLPFNVIGISSKPPGSIKFHEKLIDCVEHIILYPFDFEEYLWATGYEWYSDVIREHFTKNTKVPDIVHRELLSIFEEYLNVGGFPRVINEYVNTETAINISEQQNSILESFYTDARNHTDESLYIKVKSILSSMDMQIGKKNKKFQYKLIRKGATKNLYIDGIYYMQHANMVMKVDKLDSDQFKLYLSDVGLQMSMILAEKNQVSRDDRQVRKGIIENCIVQNLMPHYPKIYFWESNAQAKIDLILKDNLDMIPIEVSIDNNTRTKSLSIFKSIYHVKKSIKISTKNFGYRNNIKYIPLYAVFCLDEKF